MMNNIQLLACFVLLPLIASYHGSDYHWGRTKNPFTLQVVKSIVNTNNQWENNLQTVLNDWSQSEVVNLLVTSEESSSSIRQSCPSIPGKIRVCNYDYGNQVWAGKTVYTFNQQTGLILQATIKLNDYHSHTDTALRHIMCHEFGHALGLNHFMETTSVGTCMDFANNDPASLAPDSNDYESLSILYQQLDDRNSYEVMPTPTPAVPPSETPAPTRRIPEATPHPTKGSQPSPAPQLSTCGSIGKEKKCKKSKECAWDKQGKSCIADRRLELQEFYDDLDENIPPRARRVAQDQFSITYEVENGPLVTVYHILLANARN